MRLKGRIALVTGAGAGIGRAIAELFAEEGAEVWANDIDLETARATARAIGDRGHAVSADVADVEQVKKMFAEVDSTSGRLDVLVNNAGIAEASPDAMPALRQKFLAQMSEVMGGGAVKTHLDVTMDLSDSDWARMLAVHVNGTFHCTREALRLMSRNEDGGAIINMASVAGLMGLPGSPHYSAAKGAILGFTRSVAGEVASRNIRVNAICPGWIDTAMTKPLHEDPMIALMLRSRTPLGRFGEPREIATTALYLASSDSSFVTGQYISPNGGMFIG
jgi:3-oxoacyl-[acyl-carrier protein] reductase